MCPRLWSTRQWEACPGSPGDGDAGWDTLAGGAVATNTWSHIAITYDAGTDTKSLWINGAISAAAGQELKGVLGFTDEPLVSSDFNHDSHSSVFHMDQTKVMDGTLCRILTWYDNEWGFSNRMSDTAVAMGALI